METGRDTTIEFQQPAAETLVESAKEGARMIRAKIKSVLEGVEYNGNNSLEVQVTQNGKPVYFELNPGLKGVYVGKTLPDNQKGADGSDGLDFDRNLDQLPNSLANQTVELVASVLAEGGSVEVARVSLGEFDAEGNRVQQVVAAE